MGVLNGVVKSIVKDSGSTLKYSSPYGKRTFTINGKVVTDFHKGIDITTLGSIIPVSSGNIIECRDGVPGYDESRASGNYVLIDHGKGYQTIYGHLDNGSMKLKVGAYVDCNTILGTDIKKSTGYSTGLHCHFGIKYNGEWVDPMPYLLGQKKVYDYTEEQQANNENNTNTKIKESINIISNEITKIQELIK